MPRSSRARTVARTPFSSWTRGLPRPGEGVGLNNMDPNEPDGAAGAQDKPLVRGLEDVALLRPAPITRDRLAAALMEFDGALEEGLRAFDAKIPCPSCGEIDLLAVA